MAVLQELIKEIQELEKERDTAEFNYIKEFANVNDLTNLLRRFQTKVRILDEQTQKAKQGPIRGGFWLAIDEVVKLLSELDDILAEAPPEKPTEE